MFKGEIKFLIKPALLLSVVILLIVFVGFMGFRQITAMITKLNEAKTSQIALNKKISVLESIPDVISEDTTFLDAVLPNKTAVLYGLSQVKNQAIKNNLLVSDLKTGGVLSEENSVSRTLLSFDIEGQGPSVYEFLRSFSKTIPLMSVDKVKINKTADLLKASVTISVYSSELPKTIPSLSSAVNELTPQEIELLKELVSYTLPVFIQPKAQENSSKEDPFN